MAESSTIMALVGAFIAVAILLVIGIQILGGVQNSTNCNALIGGTHISNGTSGVKVTVNNSPTNSTGWALSCFSANSSTQSAYSLLIVILIIVAAAAILFVVKLI